MANKRSEKILCAFCKLSHRIYLKKDIGIFDILLLFLVTGVFSFLVWNQPNNKSLILFVAMMVLLQGFMRMRWRQSVRCPHCGFDPILYKSQPEQAALQVKVFLEKRKSDPNFLLRPQPKIKPIIHKNEAWKENLPSVVEEPTPPSVDPTL